MRYFSGFCFYGEEGLFAPFLAQNDFNVAGFSYGAIKAFEYTLHATHRIDTLQLFSPAFFQDHDERFKQLQMRAFIANNAKYTQNFMQNIMYNSTVDLTPYTKEETQETLSELLYYTWDANKLHILKERGVRIEVYLGEQDRIINPLNVKEFFVPYATVYYFKNVGHLLKAY